MLANYSFVKALYATGGLRDRMTMLDVGARFGLPAFLRPVSRNLRWIGFEPDAEECARINARLGDQGRCYPTALHRDASVREFYLTRWPSASGYYAGDRDYWDRLEVGWMTAVERSMALPAQSLDGFAQEHDIGDVDLIKLDAEGAETDIISGGRAAIERWGVLCVVAEARFLPTGQQHATGERVPVFSDLDGLLCRIGFAFFDLVPRRHARATMPTFHDLISDQHRRMPGPSVYGQVVAADAVYFRDAVSECFGNPAAQEDWPRERLLKLAALYSLFGLVDCAAEVLDVFRDRLIGLPVDRYLDSLVPLPGMTYRRYREKVARENAKPPGWTVRRARQRMAGALAELVRSTLAFALALMPSAAESALRRLTGRL